MKIKTAELTGAALDWAVAKCEGRENDGEWDENFSSNWLLGGPIIEREGIGIAHAENGTDWVAMRRYTFQRDDAYWDGPTPLIAAMRCYVAFRLGEEVNVPQELV